jgi:hypothetical protein
MELLMMIFIKEISVAAIECSRSVEIFTLHARPPVAKPDNSTIRLRFIPRPREIAQPMHRWIARRLYFWM